MALGKDPKKGKQWTPEWIRQPRPRPWTLDIILKELGTPEKFLRRPVAIILKTNLVWGGGDNYKNTIIFVTINTL